MDPAHQWHLLNDPELKEDDMTVNGPPPPDQPQGGPTSPPPPLKREPVQRVHLTPAQVPLAACSQELYAAGKPSPRTCARCGLGPCQVVLAPQRPSKDLPPQPGDDKVLPGGVTMGELFGRPKPLETTEGVPLAERIQARIRGRDKFEEVVALVEFSSIDGTARYEREGFWRAAYAQAQQAVGEEKDVTQPMGELESSRFEQIQVGFGERPIDLWADKPGSWLAWLKPLVVKQYRYLTSDRAKRKIEAAERAGD